MKFFKNPFFLTALSGILCTLSMYPFSFSFLIWIVLVPFLYVLLTSKFEKKKIVGMEYSSPAIRGLILGLVFYYSSLYWFYSVLGFSGLALLIILALYLYVFSLVLRLLLNKRTNLYIQMFLPAILWVAIEFFKSEGWRLKFTWMNLGYSQYNNPFLVQFASIGGQYGITFLIVLVNTILALMIIHRKNRKFILTSGVSILTIFTAMFGRGYIQNQKTFDPDISVGMVQYEPQPSDLNPIDIYDDLAQLLTGDYDFLIFPEYTSTAYLEETKYNWDIIVDIATRNNAYVVAGSNYREDISKDDHYNTAYLFSPEGENIGKFYKLNPVQFFKDGMPGKEFKTFQTEFGTVGIMICYDMDYSYVSRKITANGAEVLFVPTFDARHWGEFQHNQHATMTSMRAVENGRYLVRVASSGISQIIDPLGNEITRIGFDIADVDEAYISLISKKTFYTRFGWILPYICVLLVLCGGVSLLIEKWRGKKINSSK